MNVLVIPDSHIEQGQNLERFDRLGSFIIKERPDVIISMGDFVSMSSINHWDMNKKLTMEGKRYRLDMQAGNEALDKMLKPLHNLQQKQRFFKTKLYKPHLIYLEGNHEFWVQKYVEQNPAMEGQIGTHLDLKLTVRGFEYIPYKRYVDINGVQFTHMPMNGAGQAVSGSNICDKVARYVAKSTVFAHTHRWEHSVVERVGQEPIQILTTGCFFEPGAEAFGLHRWRGITMLDIFEYGRFDVKQISLGRL